MDFISLLIVFVIFVTWGLGSFFAKLAADRIGTRSVLFDYLAAFFVIIIYIFTVFKSKEIFALFKENKTGVLLALLAGLIASLGGISFYMLLSRKEVSTLVPMTALYPALTVILAIIFLHESVTLTKVTGILLSLIAIYLLSK